MQKLRNHSASKVSPALTALVVDPRLLAFFEITACFGLELFENI
jgi:hypothetical protein